MAAAENDFTKQQIKEVHDYLDGLPGIGKVLSLASAVRVAEDYAEEELDGMQLGLNARAALICRVVAKMIRLGTTMGGAAETFMSMSGIRDLVLTETGNLSRNHNLREKLS